MVVGIYPNRDLNILPLFALHLEYFDRFSNYTHCAFANDTDRTGLAKDCVVCLCRSRCNCPPITCSCLFHDDPSKTTTVLVTADKPDSLLIATWVLTYSASVWHKLKKSCSQEATQSFTSSERQQRAPREYN